MNVLVQATEENLDPEAELERIEAEIGKFSEVLRNETQFSNLRRLIEYLFVDDELPMYLEQTRETVSQLRGRLEQLDRLLESLTSFLSSLRSYVNSEFSGSAQNVDMELILELLQYPPFRQLLFESIRRVLRPARR